MTRLGDFSNETLAVDAISADIALLEKLAARGGVLPDDDLALLVQCNARMMRLLPSLSAGNTPCRPSTSAATAQTTPLSGNSAKPVKLRESAA